MPLAKPSQFTNKMNHEGEKCNGSDPQQADEVDVAYESGDATEMLSQSVQKLKIDNVREDFRAQAGKILTIMLENRLNQQNAMNANGPNDKYGKIVNGNRNRLPGANGSKGKPILRDKPFLPLPKPIARKSPAPPIISNAFVSVASAADTNDDELEKMLPPPSPIPDLSLPPPPAELIIPNDDYAIDQKNASDINDNEIRQIVDDADIKQSVDGISAVRANTQSHTQHNGHSGIVYRNKNTTRPELTTHARDRRSYIGQDKFNPNQFNNNNNLITSHTTEIASNFANGKHPICSVCHVKITR